MTNSMAAQMRLYSMVQGNRNGAASSSSLLMMFFFLVHKLVRWLKSNNSVGISVVISSP